MDVGKIANLNCKTITTEACTINDCDGACTDCAYGSPRNDCLCYYMNVDDCSGYTADSCLGHFKIIDF